MKCLNELRAGPDIENKKIKVLFHTLRCQATNPVVSFGHYHSAN